MSGTGLSRGTGGSPGIQAAWWGVWSGARNRDKFHECLARKRSRRGRRRFLGKPESEYQRQENWQRYLGLWLSIYLLSFKEFHIASKVLETAESTLKFF
jgi:hypothetical protein